MSEAIQSCCNSLVSCSKIAEKRKLIERILGLLNESDTIEALNKNYASSRKFTWENLVEICHETLLSETKKSRTGVAGTSIMPAASSLLSSAVKKANGPFGFPMLKGLNLRTKVMRVLNDPDIRNCVGHLYLDILLNQLVKERRYWADLTPDHWIELFEICIKLYKLTPDQSQKVTLLQILYCIVLHGGNQSHLGLTVKKSFSFLEEAFKANGIQKALSTELLKLATLFCSQLVYESRTEICHLGECVIPAVMALEHTPDKAVWFPFMTLQLQVHHPLGVREGEGAAFAASWETWRQLLRKIYSLVETEIQSTERITKIWRHKSLDGRGAMVGLSENLVQLAVAVCRQVFSDRWSSLDVTQINATASTSTEPPFKRRRLAVYDLATVKEVLSAASKLDENWAWLAVLAAIADRHPDMVPGAEYLPLLELMCELQSSSTNAFVVGYICQCLISLLKVEHHWQKNNTLDKVAIQSAWRRIWDTTLRSVGLNQNAESSHKLLQALLSDGTITQASSLLQMFLSGAIRISEASLGTLEVIFQHCTIPDEINHECTRTSLLEWLLPQDLNIAMKIWTELPVKLWARVLVELMLTRRLGVHMQDEQVPDCECAKSNAVGYGYLLSAFESGLLVNDSYESGEKLTATPKLLYDRRWKDRLLEELNKLFVRLLETDVAGLDYRLIVKLLSSTELLVLTLDRMLVLEVETWARIQTSNLSALLTGLLNKVGAASSDLLKDAISKPASFASNRLLLNKFTQFFCHTWHSDLANFVRKITPQKFLYATFSLAKTSSTALDKATPKGDFDCDETDDVDNCELTESPAESNSLMSQELLSPREKLQFESSACLASYSCQPGRTMEQTQKIVAKFCEHCADSNLANVADFQKAVHFLRRVASTSVGARLPMEQVMKLVENICKSVHKDGDAATLLLGLIEDLLKHISVEGVEPEDRSNILVILATFKNFFARKKYGPKVCVQYIKCLKELVKVDPHSTWAKWSCGSSVPNAAEDPHKTPVCEEALFHLSSPYHEVRICAAGMVATLFGCSAMLGLEADLVWEARLYNKLFIVASASFIIEGEITPREAADESANRTASVLHALAALIVTSPRCRRRALFFILQLAKDKNISIELIHKVLKIVGKSLKLADIIKFMEKNLNYLLIHWLALYELTAFPWKLVGCSSEVDFLSRYKELIVPILLKKEDTAGLEQLCKKLGATLPATLEACYPSVMSRFLPCYAIDNDGDGDNAEVTAEERRVAKWAHGFMEQALTKEAVDALLTEHLCAVVVGVARLLRDAAHFRRLCGCRVALPDPDPPFFSADVVLKTFKYLQDNSPTPELKLVEFLEGENPAYIQTILLRLATDIREAPTPTDRLTALHRYCTFCDFLAAAELRHLAAFVVRDVTHRLVHLAARGARDREPALAAAACHFLRVFCAACVPKHAAILAGHVGNVIGSAIPLAAMGGGVGREAAALLSLLVVEMGERFLRDAIKCLDPFPTGQPVFEEMQKVYLRVNARESRSLLEDDIWQFLKTGCKADSLLLLRSKLSEKKLELEMLYKELAEMRGFSEDCEASVLHQLCCKLVQLTADPDPKVSMEAACCLGELGPADLTTMVLKPEAKLGKADCPVLALAALATDLLVGFLVDESIEVVAAASDTLYALLGSEEGMRAAVLDKKHAKIIVPFVSESSPKGKYRSTLSIDEPTFVSTMDRPTLWCPTEECSHDAWIARLVTALLRAFPDDSYLGKLVPICQVKASFAEEILPLLIELVICHGTEKCAEVVSRHMGLFFSKRYERLHEDHQFSVSPALEFKHSKDEVCFNKASVQCMLNVVQFVRMQRSSSQMASRSGLDLDYLHVALAAQFCSAYFTSVLYAEVWCRSINSKRSDKERSQLHNVSMLDYITDKDPEGGKIVQKLFREAYMKLGDVDAVSGCGSAHLLDPHTRVRHYELRGQWGDAMLQYDLELASGSQAANRGMLSALHKFGLLHVLHAYQRVDVSAERDPIYYDCLWRLGEWTVSTDDELKRSGLARKPLADRQAATDDYHRQHYAALKALKNADAAGLDSALSAARRCVIESLAHASLESSKSVYPALSRLQTLQEVQDFAAAARDNNYDALLGKWERTVRVDFNDFSHLEPILAQRSAMLGVAADRQPGRAAELHRVLVDAELTTASIARREGSFQVATRCFGKLHRLAAGLPSDVTARLRLEEAELCWARGDHEVGKLILQSLLDRFAASPPRFDADVAVNSKALLTFGDWLVETKSENPVVIVERYLEKSLEVLEGGRRPEGERLEAYASLARFADSEYQRVTRYLNSSEVVTKRECLEKAKQDASKLGEGTSKGNESEVRQAIRLNKRQSEIDEKEIENTETTQVNYLLMAMRYYMLSLEFGTEDKNNLQVFRFVSLWLENTTQPDLNRMLTDKLDKIPSYKFLPLLPQLAPRIGSNKNDQFADKINKLLERCAIDHPHHTLPLILAVSLAYRDQDYTKEKAKNPAERVIGAGHLVARLRSHAAVGPIVHRMEQLSDALIELANHETGKNRPSTFPIPKSMKLLKLKSLESVLVPSVTIAVQSNAQYPHIIGIQSFEGNFNLVGGINAPKKIKCLGTDGIKRPQLLKGKDDLRQDAVMQQVFTIMNALLKTNPEARKDKLVIRTYKVVPLSQRSGVLEWCENTEPIGQYLASPAEGAHAKYHPQDLTVAQCRAKIGEVSDKSDGKRLQVYLEVTSKLQPVFHQFFLENFPTPGVWFERRQAYIHSVATTSMVGYILGLGDRHVQNILIDQITAEVIHIDFGVAFEQGNVLPLPENVPFRLTRDIEDGMGVAGVEGVFRRSCEKTMSVLRQNRESILTILEVLLYDPLYAWTITPTKAYNLQQQNRRKVTDSAEASQRDVNKLAERALLRLQQKLQGTEEGISTSVTGQVGRLIQQARDPGNLSRLYSGWQAYL